MWFIFLNNILSTLKDKQWGFSYITQRPNVCSHNWDFLNTKHCTYIIELNIYLTFHEKWIKCTLVQCFISMSSFKVNTSLLVCCWLLVLLPWGWDPSTPLNNKSRGGRGYNIFLCWDSNPIPKFYVWTQSGLLKSKFHGMLLLARSGLTEIDLTQLI